MVRTRGNGSRRPGLVPPVLFLLVALVARALVPAGYMVGDAVGRPVLILCPYSSPPPMAAPAHHEGLGDHLGDRHREPAAPAPECAFAALLSPALPPALPAIAPPPPDPESRPFLEPKSRAAPPRLAAPPPPARGPPLLAFA
jgi:hypothetical protein